MKIFRSNGVTSSCYILVNYNGTRRADVLEMRDVAESGHDVPDGI